MTSQDEPSFFQLGQDSHLCRNRTFQRGSSGKGTTSKAQGLGGAGLERSGKRLAELVSSSSSSARRVCKGRR